MSRLECKKHPRYKGLRRPRTACSRCWAIFLLMGHYVMSMSEAIEFCLEEYAKLKVKQQKGCE